METDVLVIGGGVTGAGLGWDLAQRGVRVIVAEMGDLSTGTSGRYHGLLHSGGRYAVRDAESAKECIDENMILRRIAPQAIEDTGGLFILCPGDDEAYIDPWLHACAAVGIPTEAVPIQRVLQREPAINPRIGAAYAVPDGSCDSWDIAHMLQRSAEAAGGQFLTYHRVDSFHIQDNRIVGARMTDLRTNTHVDVTCQVVVNATGPWAAQVAALAGAHIQMRLSRGAMLAFNIRWVNTVVNRLRPPGDGDIFVPVGTVSVTGTTSVPTDDPGDTRVEAWEVERILDLTEAMTPGISRARLLRAWGGVRPLYDPNEGDDGREAARTFSVLDHGARDGIHGLLSIVGGKLTTFRLMAEKAGDAACALLGVTTPSATATTVLASSEAPKLHHLRGRLDHLEHGETPGPLVCECELVTARQIRTALATGEVFTLNDLRRDLRLGMGPCQGGFCAFRAAAIVYEVKHDSLDDTHALLHEFVERRFGGMKPLLWGHNLRQALLAEQMYARIVGLTPARPTQTPPPLTPQPAPAPTHTRATRIVVVGAGLAGLMAALTAAEAGARVELVAFGQGAITLQPGWIETGDVAALASTEGHPYALAADALANGLARLNRVLPLSGGPLQAITASGQPRPAAFAAGGALRALQPDSKIAVVGIDQWRDFYGGLIADALRAQGHDATHFDVQLHHEIGNFDEWPVDVANLLDTREGLEMLTRQVKPQLHGAQVAAFPAVLGFKAETRARIAEVLGCAILEISTLPPSVPGLRLYHALRQALLDRDVRMTIGPRAVALVRDGARVTGVNIETASERARTIYGDAVILATGGLYGGGLTTDFRRQLHEPLAGLPLANVPDGDWFTQPLTSGQRQPIHGVGVRADAQMRPLNDAGHPFALNLYAAGRMLAGASPLVEGCGEGVDIATGTKAAQEALAALPERVGITGA